MLWRMESKSQHPLPLQPLILGSLVTRPQAAQYRGGHIPALCFPLGILHPDFLGSFLSCRWLHEHFCVDGHKSVSEYSQMLGIEANSLLKLKTLISFWIVAKMCVCRSWNQLQLSGHPTSRLKDGVKVSTSACCGGWSQSLNIRKMTHYYYWRSIKRKKRLTWIEWSCSRCSPFSFPSPLSKISVKAQWLPLICSQADSFLAYITVRSSEKQRYRFH